MVKGAGLDPLVLTPDWQVVVGTLAWALHSGCLGGLLLRLGDDAGLRAPNEALRLFFGCALGMAVNILGLQALGFAGGFTRGGVLAWAVLALLGGLVAQRVWRLRARPEQVPADVRDTWAARLIATVVLGVVCWGAGVAPGHWDDTMYHLPLALSYVEHGAVVLSPHLRFPLFPQNMNLVQGLGLLWGDVRLAQAFSTLPLGLSLLGLVGASQWLMGARFWGLLAGLLLWLATPVKLTWGFAYVDNGLGLFCWAATLALALAAPRAPGQRWHLGWVTVAATLAATAAGTKYFGAVFAVLLGLLLLPSARREPAFWLYAVLGLLLGSAWYLRSFWMSGDPVHPAGGAVFGHFLWTADDLLNQQAEQAGFGVARQPWRIFEALALAGLGWWGLAVAGLWGGWRRGGPVGVLQGVFLLYLVFWFAVTQVERYLAPIHGVASFLAVWAVVRGADGLRVLASGGSGRSGRQTGANPGPRRWIDDTACAVVLVLLLVLVAPKAWSRAQTFEADLARRPGHALMQHANALRRTQGEQLAQLFFEDARFYFRGTVHGDYFGPARYWPAVRCTQGAGCAVASPQALADFVRRFGGRMVVIGTRQLHIDLPAYTGLFELAHQTPDGVLLVLRAP